MRRQGLFPLLTGLLLLFGAQPSFYAQTKSAEADFKDVYDTIREHLAGVTDVELNRAAVQGLLTSLRSKVSLAASESSTNLVSSSPLISKSSFYEGDIGYARIGRVGEGLPEALKESIDKLGVTNKLKGVV